MVCSKSNTDSHDIFQALALGKRAAKGKPTCSFKSGEADIERQGTRG